MESTCSSVPPSQDAESATTGGSEGVSGSPFKAPASSSDLNLLNQWMQANGKEGIEFKKLKKSGSYFLEQLDNIYSILCTMVGRSFSQNDVATWQQDSVLYGQTIQQLQNHYNSCSSNAEKVTTLSVLPASLSVEQIRNNFEASHRMIRKVKELCSTSKSILFTTNKKPGRKLDDKTTVAVKDYYYSPTVSKELPGKNDVVSVKENGKRVTKRKRLVLGNLRHLYDEFCKESGSAFSLSFSKFAFLRPKECVLANAKGMHNVCVCTIHENPKLMFDGVHLAQAANLNVTSVTDCLKYLICSESSETCYLRTCTDCADWSALRLELEKFFDDEMIDEVTYNQWETTDRGNILTLTNSVEDFIDRFLQQLEDLVTHHFIFQKQAKYMQNCVRDLKVGELLLVGDFAENYSFIVQNSVQSFYFSSKQATIHPFSVYLKHPLNNELKQISCAVISDCMDHSTVAFSAFRAKLLEYLRKEFVIDKVYYFSDGCAGQYKNKMAVSNVWYHHKDFNSTAEWHFFATSHGKSACDGIGGTIKRLASLYSLQHTNPGEQITTPQRLSEWSISNIKGIFTLWVSKESVEEEEKRLEVRFKTAFSIEGIKSSHCILPVHDESSVLIKKFSAASAGIKREISTAEDINLKFQDVKGFVTFWDKKEAVWHLGHVEKSNESKNKITLKKLVNRKGKKYDFEYSNNSLSCSLDSILTTTRATSVAQGKFVKLLAAEVTIADVILKKRVAEFSG